MAGSGDGCGITDGRTEPGPPDYSRSPSITSRAPETTDAPTATPPATECRRGGAALEARREAREDPRPRAPPSLAPGRARSDVTLRSPNERRLCGEAPFPPSPAAGRPLGPPPGEESEEARGRGGLRRRKAASGCGRSVRAQGAAHLRPMSSRWRRRGRRREEEEGGPESAGAGRGAAGAAGWGCCS